uniref:Ig-like domain-containing protein n=1 Tax=Canis lupus familiaris TaxID=9615 RepID=A0A8I3PWK2_CANLF
GALHRKVDDFTALAGQTVTLQAAVRGSEPISVTWMKGQEILKEDGKIKTSFSNGVATLIIPDVQISHGDKYTCLAENEAGSQTSVGELIVKDRDIAPFFTKPLRNVASVVGSACRLDCRIAGSLPMRVAWFKDGRELASGDKYRAAFVEGTASLEIHGVDLSDAGTFTCRATNSVGSKDSSGALVPPSFVTKPASKDVLPGSAVCLKSTFRGSGPFTVRWLKGGRELVSGGSCYITKEASESSLELYVVKTSDSGTYTCQVGNAAGSVECSANLFVKEPATFIEKLEPSQLLKKGDSTQLACKVAGTPPIKITWFANDRELKEGGRHRMSFVESTAVLSLTEVTTEDSGEYMCEAQNEAGSDHCGSILIVKESPYFTKEFKPVEVLKEYDVMLLAEVAGTPPFDITWFKDNTMLRSGRKYKTFIQDQLVSLQILKFVATDAGEYQCRVTNEVGSSTCSARVTLREPPSFVKKIESTSSLRGGTAAFQATLKGSLPITVTWLKDNDEITEDDNIRMTFENNVASLYLSGIEVKHDGKYVCQAKNDAGIQRCSALSKMMLEEAAARLALMY